MTTPDITILRALATRYLELCQSEAQRACRDLWRQHNSLVRTRPPIYVRAVTWNELTELKQLQCLDPFYREYEYWFRAQLYRATIGDDFTFYPWVAVQATRVTPAEGLWGVEIKRIPSTEPGGSWHYDPPLKQLEDSKKLVPPRHRIDEEATARDVARVQEAIGDILPVIVDRSPLYRVWNADLSYPLANLRGLEQMMWDMADDPEWLHDLLAFLRDGVLAAQAEAEAAGDWRLCNHENQAMPYAEELPDPSADPTPVTRKQLWCFTAAQEFTLVSPAMHDEFLLQYQLPIMSHFGLVAYGCCEDLSEKIDMLRQIPNLRRIAVAPRANVRRCAEQIGTDYVFSYRPNPAEMVSCGFDQEHVRAVIRRDLEAAKGCHVDITLKDVETTQGQPERLHEWTRIVREIVEEY